MRQVAEQSGLRVRAVGHRVVHGGSQFRSATLVDDKVLAAIEKLSELAPLHNPPAVEGMRGAIKAFPGVPQTVVFDTAYFSDLPPVNANNALPAKWADEWGIRRYGFHGTSHAYCAIRAREMIGDRGRPLKVITCHLGNGCSATANLGEKAVATTMGFTPMDGLMMGARAGSVDPGILIYVQRRHGLTADDIDRALNKEAGLKGVSRVAADMRQVRKAAETGDERAKLALAMYVDRIRTTIGSFFVALGGLDAIVFTAGVGENDPLIRASVCAGLACIGVHIDEAKNSSAKPDVDIASSDSPVRVLVIRTREEQQIAAESLRLLRG
jgi:acetate kinase